jgi:protein phosphatase
VPLTRSAKLASSPGLRASIASAERASVSRSKARNVRQVGDTGGILVADHLEDETEVRKEKKASPARRRKDPTAARSPRVITVRLVVFLIAIAGILAGAWGLIRWYLDTSYFLTVQGSQIVIDQGKPGGFLWFDPKTVARTGVTTKEVPANQVQGLLSGSYSESSPAAAKALVRRMVVTECEYEQGVYGDTTTTAPPPNLPTIAQCPTAQKPVVTSPPTTSAPSTTSTTAKRIQGPGSTTTSQKGATG